MSRYFSAGLLCYRRSIGAPVAMGCRWSSIPRHELVPSKISRQRCAFAKHHLGYPLVGFDSLNHRAGRDNAVLTEPTLSQENCLKTRTPSLRAAVPPSRPRCSPKGGVVCTLCWADTRCAYRLGWNSVLSHSYSS